MTRCSVPFARWCSASLAWWCNVGTTTAKSALNSCKGDVGIWERERERERERCLGIGGLNARIVVGVACFQSLILVMLLAIISSPQ